MFIYTYYLIQHEIYDVFDILVDQFLGISQQYCQTLTASELNDFCLTYFAHISPDCVDPPISNKLLTRLTGLLPLTKENFDLKNRETISCIFTMRWNVERHYDNILRTISSEEWPLFRDGLVFYLSFALLTIPGYTVELIHQTRNTEWRKDLSTVLLQRLVQLRNPILSLGWADLFLHADPKRISSDCLQLYIMTLVRILEGESNPRRIQPQIGEQFNQLIFENHLPGKINIKNRKVV